MGKLQVTAQQMDSAIRNLRSNNEQFRNRVNDLVSKQQELRSQWQGDANEAFNRAFETDKGKWDQFAELIDRYIEAMERIKQAYIKAEDTNKGTATTRSY
jgi:WXG100 family type VII secretion target